jgi:hypothetical protein
VESAAGDISPAALRTLGDLLHDHVPVEERELFEAIERIVPAAERQAATHETEALSPRLSPEA